MKIFPASIEQQINRVDQKRSRAIGIGLGVFAAWCVYRLIWTLYIGMTVGWFFGSLVFPFVLWGVLGVVAAVAAVGFLARAKQP
jgi:hypothetical protein